MALALLQDAVLAAAGHSATPAAAALGTFVAQGVAIYVAAEDLSMRGFSPANLVPGAVAVDDRHLVDLMLAEGTKALGCF